MNSEDGKSTVKLIIAIAVIIAVVIVGVHIAIKFINSEKVKNTQADLLLVKAKIEILKGNNNMNKDEHPLLGYQLTQIPEGIIINDFIDKHVISEDEYENYYVLDKECLEKLELQDLINKYKGYFIVNYDNFEVIYTEGYENENGMWCYKISDLKKLPENQKPKTVEQNEQTEQTNESEQEGE